MPLDVLTEELTEDEAALIWGAVQVALYASVITEPDLSEQANLRTLEATANRIRLDSIARWGRVTVRRCVDHPYRATMGVPSRCAVIDGGVACSLPPDVHTSGGGLSDALAANLVARREGVTRTTVDQPSRITRRRDR